MHFELFCEYEVPPDNALKSNDLDRIRFHGKYVWFFSYNLKKIYMFKVLIRTNSLELARTLDDNYVSFTLSPFALFFIRARIDKID